MKPIKEAIADTSKSKFFLAILIVIFTIRISSYFTLFPDSVAITRVVKIGLRLMMTFISVVLLFSLKSKNPKSKLEYQNILPLFFYCLYLFLGICSIGWTSSVPYTVLQLSMTIESLVFVWAFYQVLVIYNEVSGDHARYHKLLAYAVFYISIAFLIGLYLDPDTFYRQTHGGEVSRLGGYIINPNELGMLAVLGALAAMVEMLDKKSTVLNFIILGICIAILLLTQSRSSLGAFMLIAAYGVFKTKNVKLKLSAIVGGVLAVPVIIRTIVVKQGDLQEVMSMTGRLPFWRDLIMEGFVREPILGYGFMRISYNDKFDSIHAYAASMTHNTFIQVLLNLGLVGAFICILQMATTFYVIGSCKNKALKTFTLLLMIPLLINSMTEFGIFGESNYGILFYQFVIFSFVIKITTNEKSKLLKRH